MFRALGLLSLAFLFCATAIGQDRPRERLAYRGLVLPKAHAPAKWSVRQAVEQETTEGDLFIVETTVQPNERQGIAIYAWAQPLKEGNGEWIEDGEPFRITASRRGKEWGYESTTFRSVVAFAITSNRSDFTVMRQVQLFLPYQAMQLPAGKNFEIRYEVAATVGPAFLDQFFISRTFRRIVVRPKTFEEKIVVRVEDDVLDFTLVGAKDDLPGV